MSKENILEILQKKFPDCWFKPGVEFDGGDKRIVWSGEGSYIDAEPAFDPYSWETDPNEKMYTMMVNNKLAEFCDELGYYWESYDPGTYFLYKA